MRGARGRSVRVFGNRHNNFGSDGLQQEQGTSGSLTSPASERISSRTRHNVPQRLKTIAFTSRFYAIS